ncbi:MAG: DUF1523 family protein [Stappiaceae bacterium]
MRYIKWIVGIPVVILVLICLHYTLPSRDIVRIVGTDVKRMDISSSSFFWANQDAGTNLADTRDVRFINAVWPDGEPRVYRNEDTDFGWPPYFKFDSGNVTAEAQDLAKRDEVWVAVTHYGWRIKLFTIFPNAISIEPVSGPGAFLIPWFNILFFTVIAAVLYLVFRTVKSFKARRIDPILETIDDVVDDVGESADQAQAKAAEVKKGFRAWLKRWFGEAR